MIKPVSGGICAPKGFMAAGIYAGIKKNLLSKDLALVFSEAPAVAAGVFTTNKIKAACVLVSMENLKNNKAQAIIANSGNANCCTGIEGIKDAYETVSVTARALGIKEDEVLVASTGIIGRPLPMPKIINAIVPLVKRLSTKNSREAAAAIMTTDKAIKEAAVRFKTGGNVVTIGGIAKGSGMICPNMATMLCFITTDAAIEPKALDGALRHCVEMSFNSITVDGDMSTNDLAFILANGAAKNKRITLGANKDFSDFKEALLKVMTSLAVMIVRDGEGATKLIEVNIKGAKDAKEAKLAAQAIANSNLVKTAIYGQDANWGRILAALGRSGASFSKDRIFVYFDNVKLFAKGRPTNADEAVLKNILAKKEIKITADLGSGKGASRMWTCDLSEEYVRINAKYRT